MKHDQENQDAATPCPVLTPPACSEAPADQMDDNHAICPYCRYENYVEAEDYDSNEREQECAECGKTYLQYDDFTVTHYTRPCPQNLECSHGPNQKQ